MRVCKEEKNPKPGLYVAGQEGTHTGSMEKCICHLVVTKMGHKGGKDFTEDSPAPKFRTTGAHFFISKKCSADMERKTTKNNRNWKTSE